MKKERSKEENDKKMWDIIAIIVCIGVLGVFLNQSEIVEEREKSKDKAEEKVKVMVDIGHGGGDRGTIGDSRGITINEKDVNLEIGKLLIGSLRNIKGIEVVSTREEDIEVSLDDRVEKAKEEGVDIFISIHANSAKEGLEGREEIKGIETFYYTEGDGSKELGEKVQKRVVEMTGGIDRGVKFGDYEVLRESEIPAILIESGFLSNKEECSLLIDKSYQKKIVIGIVEGVLEYIDERVEGRLRGE